MPDRPIRERPTASLPRRAQPHVSRRPPMTGRYRSPSPPSIRRGPRSAGLPWPARILLAAAIIVLCGSVLLIASGMLGSAVSGFGGAVQSLFGAVAGPSPTASPTLASVPEAPRLIDPNNHYTNKPTWDVHGYAPGSVVGKDGYAVRVYVNDALAREQPLTATQDFLVVGVPIPSGRSSVTATIVGPGGESKPSPPISVVYDAVPPAVTITSPKDGAVINASTVEVTGKTQTGATVLITNDVTHQSTTAVASGSTFSIMVPLGSGTNHLAVTATDLAGNTQTRTISVVSGSGKPAVSLHLSNARIALADLPKSISMSVTVLDANGAPVTGATVTFGLSVPGLPPATFEAQTAANGRATWTTTVPSEGVTAGNALVTVIATTPSGEQLHGAESFKIS